MMKTWTPSEHIRSAMFLTPTKTIGYEQNTSDVAVPSGSTWRWSFQWGTAAAFLTCQAPVKRHLTFIIMSLMQTQPLESLRLGWRTPGSKLTQLQQTRASPKSTSGAESWRLILRSAALVPCLVMASTSHSRTMVAVCLLSLSASFTGSALASSQMVHSFKKRFQEQKAPLWWLPGECAFPMQRRWMCQSSYTVMEMENGWCPSDAVYARLGMRLWRMGQSVEVGLPMSKITPSWRWW